MTRPGVAATGLLTTGEVAAAFRRSQRTVRDWAATGLLPCHRTPGGRYRYRRADVDALRGGTAPVHGRAAS